jgi:hypothetical protein
VSVLVAAGVFARAPEAAAEPLELKMPQLTPGRDAASDATPAPDPFTTRPRAVMLSGGVGGPLGYGGLSFEYAPVKWLVLGGGSGTDGHGVRVAAWPRLRLKVLPWMALGFGTPVSFGTNVVWDSGQLCVPSLGGGVTDCSYHVRRDWTTAVFGHLEPSVEVRVPWGGVLRFFGGRSQILNPGDGRCESNLAGGCPSKGGEVTWYGGLAVGYAF